MTTAELNQFLENIAKLIEATADDPAKAPLLKHPERRAGSLTPAALIITE